MSFLTIPVHLNALADFVRGKGAAEQGMQLGALACKVDNIWHTTLLRLSVQCSSLHVQTNVVLHLFMHRRRRGEGHSGAG